MVAAHARDPAVTDRIALIIALLILAALGADWVLNGGAASLFLFAKFTRLVDWAVFWW
jgi:hypothetical protein